MNNHEWLLEQKDLEKLGHDLCLMTDIEKQDCDCCPVSNYCSIGSNGYIKWLGMEHKGDMKGNGDDRFELEEG